MLFPSLSQPLPVLWDPSGLLRADLHVFNSFFEGLVAVSLNH